MEQEVMNQVAEQLENSQQSMPEGQPQLAENPFKVTSVTPADAEPPLNYVDGDEPQQELPIENEAQQATQEAVEDIEALRAKLAELESRLSEAPKTKVEYRMPDEVRELLENPATLQILNQDYNNMSVLDLIKGAFRESNPWATTDRHIEAHLRRQYPDIDFDIPENLGLAQEDYDAIAWQAEGIRQNLITQQHEVKGKLEAAKAPVTTQADLDAYQNAFQGLVEEGIKSIKPEPLSLDIPGYKMPQVDFEKVRDIVYSDAVPLSLDSEGNVWPNMKAAAAMAELELLKSQIPAMLEAARRAAPKEAVEAISRTLNNQVPQNNVAPINPQQVAQARSATLGGLRIVGVQSNF